MKRQQEISSGLIFSSQVRSLMAELNASQEDVAVAVGVTQGAVSGWLKGSIPKGDTLYRAACYFGVTMETLLTGKVVAINSELRREVRQSGLSEEAKRLAEQAALIVVALNNELKKMA